MTFIQKCASELATARDRLHGAVPSSPAVRHCRRHGTLEPADTSMNRMGESVSSISLQTGSSVETAAVTAASKHNASIERRRSIIRLTNIMDSEER